MFSSINDQLKDIIQNCYLNHPNVINSPGVNDALKLVKWGHQTNVMCIKIVADVWN